MKSFWIILIDILLLGKTVTRKKIKHRSAYVWEGPWPKTYIRLPMIIIHEPFFGCAADPQRPSSTNENEITSRTQYTLDFHHVPRSFGYIKQVEKRTCQREGFVFVFVELVQQMIFSSSSSSSSFVAYYILIRRESGSRCCYSYLWWQRCNCNILNFKQMRNHFKFCILYANVFKNTY